jgi:hypothetical protein
VVQCVFTNTDISGWSNLAVPREIHTPTLAGEQLVALRTLVGVVICLHSIVGEICRLHAYQRQISMVAVLL